MSPAPSESYKISEFTSNWDLTSLLAEDFATPINTIHLCALRNDLNEGDEAGEPPTNHWTMCLQISPQSSVMLDMAPGYGSDGLRGKIEGSSLGEPYTKETLKTLSFEPIRAITVRDIMRLIRENGRDKFNFSPQWEGCRFWMSVLMRDFGNAGIVQETSTGVAREALLRYWRNPEGSELREMREGTFRNL